METHVRRDGKLVMYLTNETEETAVEAWMAHASGQTIAEAVKLVFPRQVVPAAKEEQEELPKAKKGRKPRAAKTPPVETAPVAEEPAEAESEDDTAEEDEKNAPVPRETKTPVSYTDVRTYCRDKFSQKPDLQARVLEVIAELGGRGLNDVPEEDLPELMARCRNIAGENNGQ